MLEQEYKTLYKCASIIKDWRTINKNDLANKYIDNEKDEVLKEAYFSALMLRYWGNIGKYYTNSKASGFTIEDCYSWLIEALMYALNQRKWKYPNCSLYNDKNGPDKIINRCIYSRRQYYYYLSNTANRKTNFCTLSVDNNENIDEDHNVNLIDTSCLTYNISKDISTVSYFLYKDNKWFESFLLNYLNLNDFLIYSKKEAKWEINKRSLISSIKNISYETFRLIVTKISTNITEENIKNNYKELKEIKQNKLKNIINQSLINLKENNNLKELLCY